MSKDLIKTKKQTVETVETVEKLKIVTRMLNDVISGSHCWNIDKIFPMNLYVDILENCRSILSNIIFQHDINQKGNKEIPF